MALPAPLPVVLLPGLDGTARLFDRLLAAASGKLDLRPLQYPPDEVLGYEALEERVRRELPRRGPFLLLGESFSGPLALRIAASPPPGLRGLVLATTFHRAPAAAPIAALKALAPAFFRLPLPRHVVRLLLAGGAAPAALVEEVRTAVALVQGRVMAARAHEALRVDASRELAACPVPILVLAGRHDRLLRRSLPREMQAIRPDLEVHLLDAPHLVLQLLPEACVALLAEFAARVAQRGGAARRRAPRGAAAGARGV